MPTKADNGQTILTIGDRSRNGLLQITDTRWDSNGTLFVTIRELIGDHVLVPATSIKRMRRLARRALMYPELTRSSRVVRRFYADGCTHVTFAVSRLDPRD